MALRRLHEIDLEEQTRTTDVLCTVHLLYAAETWCSPSRTVIRKLEHARTRAYRLLQRRTVTECTPAHLRYTDDDVLATARRAPLELFLRKRRLRWLVSILTTGPPQLRYILDCLIGSAADWTRQLHGDLEWLQSQTVYPCTLSEREGPPLGRTELSGASRTGAASSDSSRIRHGSSSTEPGTAAPTQPLTGADVKLGDAPSVPHFHRPPPQS